MKERKHSNITKFKNLLRFLDDSVNKIQDRSQDDQFVDPKPNIPNKTENSYKNNISQEEIPKEEKEENDEETLPILSEEICERKYNQYILMRQKFISDVQNFKYNGIEFRSEEERANKIFKKLIRNLKGQLNDDFYKEFTMKHKDFIEKTNIYKILKKMPKGANLHLHVDTAFDLDWVRKHHIFYLKEIF